MLLKKSRQNNVIGYHARQTYSILIVFLFLIAAFFVLLLKHYNDNVEHEKKILITNFNEHVNHLDNFLSSVTTWVQGIRIQAESDIMESNTSGPLRPPTAYRFLAEEPDESGFHMDNVGPPLTRELVGNLTGAGPLKGRLPGFYREIHMALNLNPQFQSASKAIKDAAWIYYTSSRGFVNIYPWVSSKKFKFSFDMFTHEYFQLGNQAYNPTRELFWTDVYVGEYGEGLMTTCAAPVYDFDQLLGTVAIDLTVEFLNTQVKKFQAGKGIMFLVNDRSQLVAHPSLITPLDRYTKTFQQALPPALREHIRAIRQLPTDAINEIQGLFILHAELNHAPWQAFYYEKQLSVWGSVLNHVGLGAVLLLFSMIALVFSIFIVTHRQFILPSGKLVNFIMARGQGDTSHQYGKVPQIWQPWFLTIEDTFQQNEELTEKIRKQNVELEKRVAERTAKLASSNQQLRIEIDERLQAESAKQRLEAELQRAQKMEAIGTLAGGVAHDLNNVLAGLVSYPQLLLIGLSPDSPMRNPILTIQKSGEKAAAIVQDLLTLARRGVSVNEVINLNEIIKNYIESPEHNALLRSHPRVVLYTALNHDLFNIIGSPVHAAKSVMNLVSNAAEAMPEGGHIQIATENRYIDKPISGYDEVKEGDYVVLTVADKGIGISNNDLERIFEPFYTKKAMGRSGTGLGMAVVWSTVKDYGGYIDVVSQLDEGTVFTLYFPATRKTLETLPPNDDLKQYQGKGERILIVDDVYEQRKIGAMILETLGYRVDVVASGEAAVDYVRSNAPDLIVLDMIMDPGIDGLETYQQILALNPGQKAIIASGFSETQRVKEAQRLGAVTYIKKPYLVDKIAVAVRKELDRQSPPAL